MDCPHPHDHRARRCRRCTQIMRKPEALERRRKVLEALSHGRWVHGEKLRDLAYVGMSPSGVRQLISRLRREGYQIEGEQKGTGSRGYRLISEPATQAA